MSAVNDFTTLYIKKPIEVIYYSPKKKSNKWVICFNYHWTEFDILTPTNKDVGHYAWGKGRYASIGYNEINVIDTTCGYFVQHANEVVSIIRNFINKDSVILCIGQSMGGIWCYILFVPS